MVTTICLLTFALSPGQVGAGQSWQLAPQFSRGQELVYQGFFKELSLVPGVAYQRDYRLQTRLFVLEANKDGWEVAFLTALEVLPEGIGAAALNSPRLKKASVRLELARVDRQGRVHALEKVDLSPPLDGPPTLEPGFVVPVPIGRIQPQSEWHVPESNRPAQVWTVTGTDIFSGTRCLKLRAVQESPGWKNQHTGEAAWQRVEEIWFHPQLGVASRVQRDIQRREAARTVPTHVGKLSYELERQWTYPPGPLFETRKQDILQAVKMGQEADQLLADHLKNTKALDVLIKRIGNYLDQKEPVEPYRQVFEQILHRIEAVRKGKILVKKPAIEKPLIPVARAGERVPDFVVTDLVNKRSVRMYGLLGRPVLIIFYNPHTPTGLRTLQFAQKVAEQYSEGIHILGMAVTHKVAEAVQQHQELKLPFPVLDGTGLHQTFAVDATPRLIVLDSQGILRGAYTGWAFHVTQQILDDLEKCRPAKKASNP